MKSRNGEQEFESRNGEQMPPDSSPAPGTDSRDKDINFVALKSLFSLLLSLLSLLVV